MSNDSTKNEAVYRPDGVTPSERSLRRLCERSFLSLWTYPCVYYAPGKELCDLLVVFRDHVLIFSDKHCVFPDSGNLHIDWCRWFRRAVQSSAQQVWGAERKLRTQPDRLFLDPACKHPFPIDLPDPAKARFHRIVVAHDGARRCREHFGGSGSLIIDPSVIGEMHYANDATVRPFVIGQVDPSRGFAHVFDDTTLGILMRTLDTTSDFVEYLTKKEAFIQSGRLGHATGEEDLLAFYLRRLNEQGEHDFVVPPNIKAVFIYEGLWQEFATAPQRQAQSDENEVSYAWDRLIEQFGQHILAGTWADQSGLRVRDREKVIRLLASECRTARRGLAKSLLSLIGNSRADVKSARLMLPTRPGGPFYIFLLLPRLPTVPEREYREVRLKLLEAYCMVVKVLYPEAEDIVGLATEPGGSQFRSEDAAYLDAREWSQADQAEAVSLQQDLGLLTNLTGPIYSKVYEYPDPPARSVQPPNARVGRNSPCPCGSGKKYKRCCGAPK